MASAAHILEEAKMYGKTAKGNCVFVLLSGRSDADMRCEYASSLRPHFPTTPCTHDRPSAQQGAFKAAEGARTRPAVDVESQLRCPPQADTDIAEAYHRARRQPPSKSHGEAWTGLWTSWRARARASGAGATPNAAGET